VKQLLAAAETAYGGKDTPGFQAFITHEDNYGFSSLNSACKGGHVEVVKELLTAAETAYGGKDTPGFQAFITRANRDGFSPLNSACTAGHVEVVKELLVAAAAAYGDKDILGFKAFITHKNRDGFSPLNAACKRGHVEVVKQLLAAAAVAYGGKDTQGFKAFLEQKNNFGFTPLNAAAKSGHSEIANILLNYGADPDIINNIGFSARDQAKTNNQLTVLFNNSNRKRSSSSHRQDNTQVGQSENRNPKRLKTKDNNSNQNTFFHPSEQKIKEKRKEPTSNQRSQRVKTNDQHRSTKEFDIIPLSKIMSLPEQGNEKLRLKAVERDSKESKARKASLKKQASLYGFDCVDVIGGGDCLFNAVIAQLILLNIPGSTMLNVQQLRVLSAQHFYDNANLYEKTIGNIRAFVGEILKPGTWADDHVIVALSRALKITIVIISSDVTQPLVIKKQSNPEGVIYLGYEAGWHYQSLKFKDNISINALDIDIHLVGTNKKRPYCRQKKQVFHRTLASSQS